MGNELPILHDCVAGESARRYRCRDMRWCAVHTLRDYELMEGRDHAWSVLQYLCV